LEVLVHLVFNLVFHPGHAFFSTVFIHLVLFLSTSSTSTRASLSNKKAVCRAQFANSQPRFDLLLFCFNITFSFSLFLPFCSAIAKHGLPALETLAIEMKSSGLYLARGLSYRSTEFQLLSASLTAEQIDMWNAAATFMKDLKAAMAAAVERSAQAQADEKKPGGGAMRPFGSVQMRFFQQLTCAIKIPAVLAEAKRALAEGCVHISQPPPTEFLKSRNAHRL
jgi:hypothetical protein